MGAILFMLVVIGVPCAALSLTYLVVFRDGAKDTGRWGCRRQKVAVGESPYRAGESTEELSQGAPLWLRFVCWLGAMGGVATVGLLAPAGLILILIALEYGAGFAALLVVAISFSGFPAGVLLIRVARQVVRNEAVERSVFHFLYFHHVSVAGTMILLDARSRGHIEVAPFGVVVCIVLMAVIVRLHSAAKIRPEGTESAISSEPKAAE
jgi:hypothetical protein